MKGQIRVPENSGDTTVAKDAGSSATPSSISSFRDSPELRKRRVVLNIGAVLGALSGIAVIILWMNVADQYDSVDVSTGLWVASIATSVLFLVVVLTCYAFWASALGAYQDRLDRERSERLRKERDAASPEAEAELTRLLSANRALLDDYQGPVRARARTSYTFGQMAIFVGLIVLLVGVVVTLVANEPSARIGVAGLSAVGATLSGYIAHTFLRVYERAQDQLNFYFREPLVTSYLLAAERLAEKLEGERRADAYAAMVGEIVRAVRGDLGGESPTQDPSL